MNNLSRLSISIRMQKNVSQTSNEERERREHKLFSKSFLFHFISFRLPLVLTLCSKVDELKGMQRIFFAFHLFWNNLIKNIDFSKVQRRSRKKATRKLNAN